MRWSSHSRRVLSVIAGLASVISLVVPADQIPAGAASPAVQAPSGYWAVASDGGIFAG